MNVLNASLEFGVSKLYSKLYSTFIPYDVYSFWLNILPTFLHSFAVSGSRPLYPARADLEELRPFNQTDFILL